MNEIIGNIMSDWNKENDFATEAEKIRKTKMTKQEFEKLIGNRIDDDTYDSLNLVYLSFGDITNKELAAMYVNDNQLFRYGIDLARDLKLAIGIISDLHRVGMVQTGDKLDEIIHAKVKEYIAKVKEKYGNLK